MSSKLAVELATSSDYGADPDESEVLYIDNSLEAVRTVLDSFRVRVTDCWCFSPEFHTDRCKAAQALFEKLRKE